jgi:hypothetical protein
MNGKTVSQLRYFSSKEGRKFKEIKQWWKSLNWKEKTIERKRIINVIEK